MKPRSPTSWGARAGILFAALAIAAGLGLAAAQEEARRRAPDAASNRTRTRRLWFFFSPAGPDLSKEVARAAAFLEKHPDVELRPCLLVDDMGAIEHPTPEFARTLSELRALRGLEFSLPIWDEEGLALARELSIERLPAWALVVADTKSGKTKAHVACGRGAQFEECATCK